MSVSRIAEVSGVSKATVSRVLNQRPGVQAANVKAVLDAARRLQYPLPEAVGGGERGGARGSLSIAYVQFNRGLVAEQAATGLMVFEGVATAAAAEGVNLVFGAGSRADRLPEVVLSGNVDGLILAGMEPSREVLAKLRRYPQVWVTSYRTDDQVYVLPGNEQVGTLALEYLRQRGHHDVAVLNPFSQHPALGARAVIFELAAQQRGLAGQSFSVDRPFGEVDAPEHWNGLEATIEELIDRAMSCDPRPTAMFIPVASVVAMVHRVLRRRSFEPGRDLDIVTVGGEEEVMSVYPRPGIVDIAPQEMGRRALASILAKIKDPKVDDRTSIAVEPRLIPGEWASTDS